MVLTSQRIVSVVVSMGTALRATVHLKSWISMRWYMTSFSVGSWREVFFTHSFFFFSSRRRHTRFDCWSSDVCSSDLSRRSDRCHGSETGHLPGSICGHFKLTGSLLYVQLP